MKRLSGRDWWIWTVLPVMVVALYFDFVGSPNDVTLGASARILYFHIGSATVAGIAFTITAVASIGYLIQRTLTWDIWAAASAEIGLVFTTMILVSGTIWGRIAWGAWWTWDPRLTATLILWVIFAAYLLLREWSDNRARRATVSAIIALSAYIDVPIDYMTIRWWRSIHPVIFTNQGINMPVSMQIPMFISMGAMTLVFIVWMAVRMRLMRAELGVGDLKNGIRARIEGQ